MSKKSLTKKEMQKELNMFRKLSMNIIANKIFLDYKIISNITSVEPEKFVEECLETSFPQFKSKEKQEIWLNFLTNLVMLRNMAGKRIVI